MTSAKYSKSYLRFLNLIQAIRKIPTYPTLDPVEERLLNQLAVTWLQGKKISVLEAMTLSTEISATTAHRRLKTLLKKGMIALVADQTDSRIKYVMQTDLSTDYFASLGRAFEQAQQAD